MILADTHNLVYKYVMRSVAYVSSFSPEAQPVYGNNLLAKFMEPGDRLSERFGALLYDRLLDPDGKPSPEIQDLINDYTEYCGTKLNDTKYLLYKGESSDILKARSQMNFHDINFAMLQAWTGIADPNLIGSNQLNDTISLMQDALAILGLGVYIERARKAGEEAGFAYFSRENDTNRGITEGRGNEYDSGIVLLEVMRRHKGFIVVPGPSQFEHSKAKVNKNANADYVAFSRDARAVGVQIKSQVRDRDKARYDPERVVLIDGRIDLGNQLLRQTSRDSSPTIVNWSGIISTQRVMGFSPQTHDFQELRFGETIDMAQQLVGKISPKFEDAVKAVEERICVGLWGENRRSTM